jgi:hypothetical protein
MRKHESLVGLHLDGILWVLSSLHEVLHVVDEELNVGVERSEGGAGVLGQTSGQVASLGGSVVLVVISFLVGASFSVI